MTPERQDAFLQALIVAQVFWPRVRAMEAAIAFLLEEARPRVVQEGNADRLSRLSDLQRALLTAHQVPGSQELDEVMRDFLGPRPDRA